MTSCGSKGLAACTSPASWKDSEDLVTAV